MATRRQQTLARERVRELNEKPCTACGDTKALDEFSPDHKKRDGRQSHCKACRSAHQRSKHDPERARAYTLRRNYQMTHADYEVMAERQDRACAVCRVHESMIPPDKGQPGYLHIDHDHATGKVRALLCGCCNSALGYVRDDVAILRKLVAYLDTHATGQSAEE